MNTGSHHSEKSRLQMSIAAKKRKPTFLGKHHSEETKTKLREARLRQSMLFGEPGTGHHCSVKHRLLLSKVHKGKHHSVKTEFKKGRRAWNFGIKSSTKRNNIEYYTLHNWLIRHFGKANKCENKFCLHRSSAFSWAKLSTKKYERNIKNFIQLCNSCHQMYDKNSKSIRSIKANIESII